MLTIRQFRNSFLVHCPTLFENHAWLTFPLFSHNSFSIVDKSRKTHLMNLFSCRLKMITHTKTIVCLPMLHHRAYFTWKLQFNICDQGKEKSFHLFSLQCHFLLALINKCNPKLASCCSNPLGNKKPRLIRDDEHDVIILIK